MELFWSDKLKVPYKREFQEFIQLMANRIMQGHSRYGVPDPTQQYVKRIRLELAAYVRTGNKEHLINLSNYAWLESVAPGRELYHDNLVDSVTRGKV